jgi:hypothetical protein
MGGQNRHTKPKTNYSKSAKAVVKIAPPENSPSLSLPTTIQTPNSLQEHLFPANPSLCFLFAS